jgi:hypothetical protein
VQGIAEPQHVRLSREAVAFRLVLQPKPRDTYTVKAGLRAQLRRLAANYDREQSLRSTTQTRDFDYGEGTRAHTDAVLSVPNSLIEPWTSACDNDYRDHRGAAEFTEHLLSLHPSHSSPQTDEADLLAQIPHWCPPGKWRQDLELRPNDPKREYLQIDSNGNEWLDDRDWDTFPGLQTPPHALKIWNEDHGNFIVCEGCIAEKRECDHCYPCGERTVRSQPCRVAIEKPLCNPDCKFGIMCFNVHHVTKLMINEPFGVPDSEIIQWSFPSPPKHCGPSAWGYGKIPKAKHELPQAGCALPYHPLKNKYGYKGKLPSQQWLFDYHIAFNISDALRHEIRVWYAQKRNDANFDEPAPVLELLDFYIVP